jgi:CRP/FNR family cyclic AMP-dependent transcriptional regulator
MSAALSTTDKLINLRSLPAFRLVDLEDLRTLAERCQEKAYRMGERVFTEGEFGASLFIILRGTVAISQGAGARMSEVARLGPGAYFGELAIFDGGPRTATASASEAGATLLVLERQTFIQFGEKNPKVLLEVIRGLTRNVRRLGDQLRVLKVPAAELPPEEDEISDGDLPPRSRRL